jgi:Uma2 family endonuclease
MSTSTKLINYEDSLTMPENKLEEIVHGESRIIPPVHKRHAYLIRELSMTLQAQVDPREHYVTAGRPGLGIERVPLTYRIPNLMVFRTEALRLDRAETADNDPYIWAVPELVVECLSPANSKRPTQELLADYAHIALPEIWLFDPKPPQFTSYRYESGALKQWLALESGQLIPLLLPNVTVDLAQLWEAFGA